MRLLFHTPFILAASAAYLPLQPRGDPCLEAAADNELVFQDGVTTDGTAGIGAEFESPQLRFVNKGCSMENTFAARKKVVAGRVGKNFKLTADTTENAGVLQAEYILDGTSIKVGTRTGDAKKAGDDAARNLIDWKPWQSPDTLQVNIEDNACNPWTISGIKGDKEPEKVDWSPQVTAPMPLEAVYSLMKEQKEDPEKRNVLDGTNFRFPNKLIVVTRDFFQSNPNDIDGSKVTDDVLGFSSLVLNYAKAAKDRLHPNQSPKLFMTFMPRTEFNTIFEAVKSKLKGDLFDLFNILACYKNDGDNVVVDTDFCSGDASNPQSNGQFSQLEFRMNEKEMKIKDWIQGIGSGSPSPDKLTEFDKAIDGSIGGLGTVQEKMFKSERSVPLFEFRDLDTQPTSEFGAFMANVDAAVQKLHQDFSEPPQRKQKRQEAADACSAANNTTTSAPAPPSTSTQAPPETTSTVQAPEPTCPESNDDHWPSCSECPNFEPSPDNCIASEASAACRCNAPCEHVNCIL